MATKPDKFEQTAERAGLILDMRDASKKVEEAAQRAFVYSFTRPLSNVKKVNSHLMDAKKSIVAAVANLE
ncbi:hypothetical protein LCGC14_1774810 [marine sediment metagenome]|uniref:Uncharacterized protein n=1 Tax=marine sediment metagenome TaxID=412755 RepID=A0A0F9GX58_9ZZZZ